MGLLQSRLKASFYLVESPSQLMLDQVMFRVWFKICGSFCMPLKKMVIISDVYIFKSTNGKMYLFFFSCENNLP